MKIPLVDGIPTVSVSQLRTYGAGADLLDEGEEDPRGCPRQYWAKYVEGRRDPREDGYPLRYGTMIHEALFLMDEEQCSPDDALARVFAADLTPDAYAEAIGDLTEYLDRTDDLLQVIAVEQMLTAQLYVDPDFGPVNIRGQIDSLELDPSAPHLTLHGRDYKTNRSPTSQADVWRDAQLKTYHYLIAANYQQYVPAGSPAPQIVMHLDLVKFRDTAVTFDQQDIDAWHAWTVAVVRTILRDETHEPVVNPGCSYCPVRDDCPAYLALPDVGAVLAAERPEGTSPADLVLWRDKANATRLLLEKAVKGVDAELMEQAALRGGLRAGPYEWVSDTTTAQEVDVRALHSLLGDSAFYGIATVTKAALERTVKAWPPSARSEALALIQRVPNGTTWKRVKA